MKIAFAAVLGLASVANAQFAENCAGGVDSECSGTTPFCCQLTNTADSGNVINMCMTRETSQVGTTDDPDDESENNVWKFICPTMVETCASDDDCKKTDQDDNGFCCKTSVISPAGFGDSVYQCVPKYEEVPQGVAKSADTDLQSNPIGQFDKLVSYFAGGSQQYTGAGDLTYSYKCPSMLSDCEVYQRGDADAYVLDEESGDKLKEETYQCGTGDFAAKTHCCALVSDDENLPAPMKMCMEHAQGSDIFGAWSFTADSGPYSGEAMGYTYTCPTLAATCSDTNTCSGESTPFCCNLQATNPGINQKTKRCMENLGALTGSWTYSEDNADGNQNSIEFSYQCPTSVLQNCTGNSEQDCLYKQPYCCTLTNDDYQWMEGAPSSTIQMCMDEPRNENIFAGEWTDPTEAATFAYDCPLTTDFGLAASAFDEYFDYAIDYTHNAENTLLTKAGLNFDQCVEDTDCPLDIKNQSACCVETLMQSGDYDQDGVLQNIQNNTVKRCMKDQIPDSQIFTEIGSYVVQMKCANKTLRGIQHAAHISFAVFASAAAFVSTLI